MGPVREKLDGRRTEAQITWQTRYVKSSIAERKPEILGRAICSEQADFSRGRPGDIHPHCVALFVVSITTWLKAGLPVSLLMFSAVPWMMDIQII